MKKMIALLFIAVHLKAMAQQEPAEPTTFSLKQAIDYAVEKSFSVTNATLQSDMAAAKTGEVRSALLPQIAANADLVHSFQVQQNITESGYGFQANSPLPKGTPIAFQLGLKNTFVPSLSGTQVLFDQAYFSAQGAAKTNQEISEQTVTKTKIDISVNVSKAYYSVLVNEKQLNAIDKNLARMDSVYEESNARYESGLARSIDVSTALVSLNNMREQKEEVLRAIRLSRAILRYQLNVSDSNPLILTDSLHAGLVTEIEQILKKEQTPVFENRIEYLIIKNQLVYNRYDLKATMAGHYPRLLLTSTFGYNPGATQFTNLAQPERWYAYSTIGLRLQVPVFSGFAVNYRVQQKRIQQRITENNLQAMEKEIHLEVERALINLYNSMQSFAIQRDNLKLAEDNLNVLREEYKSGIALNVEVVTAEASLIQAQTNFYSAMFSALVAKADYDRATGTIIK